MMHPRDAHMILSFVMMICLSFSIPTKRQMLPALFERACAMPQYESHQLCRRKV